MEFSKQYISSLKKKSNSNRSSSPINRSEFNEIINKWYDSNKRLRCTCTETEFNEYINLNFNALEGMFGNENAIQSGGGPKIMLLLNLFALLIFITSMIYNQTQREEVKEKIIQNIDTINDAIIRFDTKHNLTHHSNLSLPLVNSSDIMNSSNFNTTLTNYMKKSMEKFLLRAKPAIFEKCEKPPTFFDSIPNFEKLVYKYVPLPTKIGRNLLRTNAEKEKKQQKEKFDEEHECYILAFQELEQNKTAEMKQFFTTITDKLIDADKEMKDEIKINLYNNMMMGIAFAYLAARFHFYQKGTPPANPGQVMAIMNQTIGGMPYIENITPEPEQLRLEGPGIQNISPPNSGDRRRAAHLLVDSPPPAPSRSATRSRRPSLRSQKYLWLSSPENPLNQGGARRRRQTRKYKRSKTKRSISKSKRRHIKTRKHK